MVFKKNTGLVYEGPYLLQYTVNECCDLGIFMIRMSLGRLCDQAKSGQLSCKCSFSSFSKDVLSKVI